MSRIAIVKPEKARAIEDMVIQMAQRGQLTAKINEDKLIELLNRAVESEDKQRTKVTVIRALSCIPGIILLTLDVCSYMNCILDEATNVL